jgi:hypothetical protein
MRRPLGGSRSLTAQPAPRHALPIIFLDKIPAYAAVNEAVELAKLAAPKPRVSSTAFCAAFLRK